MRHYVFQITKNALIANLLPIILVTSLFQSSTACSRNRKQCRLLSIFIVSYFLDKKIPAPASFEKPMRGIKCPRESNKSQANKGPSSLLADGEKTAVATPVAANPEQAQPAPRVVPIKTGHAAVAIRTHPDRAQTDNGKFPLLVRVSGAKGK